MLLLSALHSRRTSTYLVRRAKFTRNTQWNLIFRAHTSLFGHLTHLLRLLFDCSAVTCRHRACLFALFQLELGCRWRSGEISPPSPLNPITFDASVPYLMIYGYPDRDGSNLPLEFFEIHDVVVLFRCSTLHFIRFSQRCIHQNIPRSGIRAPYSGRHLFSLRNDR